MPIAKRWSKFTWDKLEDVPDVYGVYELGDAKGNIIYIGSGRLRDRLRYWKSINKVCIMQARMFRYEKICSERRCRQRERALLKDYKRRYGRLPKCNKKIG